MNQPDNATPKKDNPLLLLIDGSSYLYRAFHALPPLTNPDGQPTGAVYGVINMLQNTLNNYQPCYVAVVFDAKGKTFRNDLYPLYKANRPPMPDELRCQIEPLHAIVKGLGLPLLVIEDVEADDVIGTLATQANQKDIDVVISTGDKDMAQLVNPATSLINTMNNSTMDRQGVIDKFGIPPESIVDYLALVGDSSDNIPGIPSVGPKTAVKWLNKYTNVENLIKNASEISGKVGEKFRDNMAQIPLSKNLATIRCDVSLNEKPEDLKRQQRDDELLRHWYQKMAFNRWLNDLSPQTLSASEMTTHAEKPPERKDYPVIFTMDDFKDWVAKLETATLIAFDTETTSLNYMIAEIVGLSFALPEGDAVYIPVGHDYMDAPLQLDRDAVLKVLKPLLENENLCKVGQHLKYDKNVLANYGIDLQGIRFDTMLESYVLNSTATRHDMDSLALKYLHKETIHFETIAGKGVKQKTFNEIPIETAAPYAAEDADITMQLHQALWPQLNKENALENICTEIEFPLISVLSGMEQCGVLLDREMLAKQSKQLAADINLIVSEAHEVAGETFNLSSPKQIQSILYEKQNIPVTKKTPKGQPSTAESTLQELAVNFPLPRLILEYRSMSKLKSTYTDRLPEQINEKTGRVHTSYHQANAATGRLSSSDPNLQNIPIRTKAGRQIRQAFIAPDDYQIVAADYSQIELRILAHLSNDPGLTKVFAENGDVHRTTAAQIFAVTENNVTNEQRRSAKAINFGIIYGMSAFGLGQQLNIDRKSAQSYIDQYFERFPTVKEFMDETKELAKENGFVETLFGRRLYLPEINAKNAQRRQYAERAAINAPMQGTAADIIKKAMLITDQWIKNEAPNNRLIMQVHDELVFEVRNDELESSLPKIIYNMSHAAKLSVPLVVDVGVGLNWNDAH